MRKSTISLIIVCVMIGLTAFNMRGLKDVEGAKRVLEDQGYTHVNITGLRSFKCGGKDLWRTGFKATNDAGRTVHGTVCTTLFKSSNIRFD